MGLFRIIASTTPESNAFATNRSKQDLIGLLRDHMIAVLELVPDSGEIDSSELDYRLSAIIGCLKIPTEVDSIEILRLRVAHGVLEDVLDRILPRFNSGQRPLIQYALAALVQTLDHLEWPGMSVPLQSMYVHGKDSTQSDVRESEGFFPLLVLMKLSRRLNSGEIDRLMQLACERESFLVFEETLKDDELGIGEAAHLCMRTSIFERVLSGKVAATVWLDLDEIADDLLNVTPEKAVTDFNEKAKTIFQEILKHKQSLRETWGRQDKSFLDLMVLRAWYSVFCPHDRQVWSRNFMTFCQGFSALTSSTVNGFKGLAGLGNFEPDRVGMALLAAMGGEQIFAPRGNDVSFARKVLHLSPYLLFVIYSASQILGTQEDSDAGGRGGFFAYDQVLRGLLGLMVPQFLASFAGLIEGTQNVTGMRFRQTHSMLRGMSWVVLSILMSWVTYCYYHPDEWGPGVRPLGLGLMASLMKRGLSELATYLMGGHSHAYSTAAQARHPLVQGGRVLVGVLLSSMVFGRFVPGVIEWLYSVTGSDGDGNSLEELLAGFNDLLTACESVQVSPLSSESGGAQMRKAWRELGRCYHPDMGGNATLFNRGRELFDGISDILSSSRS